MYIHKQSMWDRWYSTLTVHGTAVQLLILNRLEGQLMVTQTQRSGALPSCFSEATVPGPILHLGFSSQVLAVSVS